MYIEQPSLRRRRTRTWQDNLNPAKKATVSSPAALHYESAPGVWSNIDCAPVRIDNAQADGWRVINNGWHYFVGRDLANHGTEDGWIGFGGRQGANYFKFRLLRVGYLRGSDRAWADLGGPPTYSRTNLTRETINAAIPNIGEQLPVEQVATWNNIWVTPGGGSLSIRWRVDGERMKEDIIINQAGRDWITANRPPGFYFPSEPLNNVWFGFVFRVDWSDIPKIIRNGVQIGENDDFADDGQPIELRDAQDNLLAFLPIDKVFADGTDSSATLRKRFYLDGDGNHYLAVGVRCDQLNELPSGDLIFDPSVNEQVAAAGDDANYVIGGSWQDTGGDQRFGVFTDTWGCWQRMTVDIPQGATIDVAKLTFQASFTRAGVTCNAVVNLNDVDNASNPTSGTDANNKVRTSNVTWASISSWTEHNNYDTPSIVAQVQTVVNRAGFVAGNYILFFVDNDGSSADAFRDGKGYDISAANAPKFYAEYTEETVAAQLSLQAKSNLRW